MAAVTGINNVIRNLRNVGRRFKEGSHNGLERSGRLIKARAQDRTPVLTGTLKSSAYSQMESTKISNDQSVIIGFRTPYAVYVHENLENFHKVGEAKYLERPLIENTENVQNILAEEIRKAIR